MFPLSRLQPRAWPGAAPLVLLAGLLAVQLVAGGSDVGRQAAGARRVLIKRQASMSATATATAQTAAAAVDGPGRAAPAGVSSRPPQGAPLRPANTRQKPQQRPGAPERDDELVDEQRQPPAARPSAAAEANRRRPNRKQFRKQQNHDDYEEEEDDENCYDYDDDRDSDLYRPLERMQRMMGNMFETMQGLSSDAFRSGRQAFRAGREGGTGASAASFANSDGFSRTSSLVNENGRTRGVVMETRNGRTKTRRIGDQDDEDFE